MSKFTDTDKRFWLNWGLAPKGTPKYQAGVKALSFLHQELDRARRESKKEGYELAIDDVAKSYVAKAKEYNKQGLNVIAKLMMDVKGIALELLNK